MAVTPTFTANTALPYAHSDRAAMGLRAQLRMAMRDAGIFSPLDWSRMEVTGPEEHRETRGQTWFDYWASIRLDMEEDAN